MKLFLLSLFMVMLVVGSWFSADFLIFKKQRSTHQALLVKMKEKECVAQELEQIQKQGNYSEKYRYILSTEQEDLESRIPQTAEVSNLLGVLSRIADETKISLHDFQTGKILDKNKWFELPITLTLSASYPELVLFLEKIALEKRLMLVQDLKYEKKQAELRLMVYFGDWQGKALNAVTAPYHCGQLAAISNLKSVFTPSNSSEKLDFQKILKRDPFVGSTVIPAAISSHPNLLKALKLTGMIRIGPQWMALLEYENGDGKLVQMGDEVAEGFVVQKFSNNAVWVAKGNQTKKLGWEGGNFQRASQNNMAQQEFSCVEFRDANIRNVLDIITYEADLKTQNLNLSGKLTLKLENSTWSKLLKIIRKQASS